MNSIRTKQFTVRQEIEKALCLFQEYGTVILRDPVSASLLNRYKTSIHRSFIIMREVGVIGACLSCAGVHTSGCCFSGVEEWYDCILLLINLLLEKDLPLEAELFDSCHFVGKNGCKLTARHSFCVNFLCPNLLKTLTRDQNDALLKTIGRELQTGWEVERMLRRNLNNYFNMNP